MRRSVGDLLRSAAECCDAGEPHRALWRIVGAMDRIRTDCADLAQAEQAKLRANGRPEAADRIKPDADFHYWLEDALTGFASGHLIAKLAEIVPPIHRQLLRAVVGR